MAAGDITDVLLVLADYNAVKEMSINIDADRIAPYSKEAQRIDLVKFLGRPLYFDWMTDQTDTTDWSKPNYQELFDGATYSDGTNTVFCHGVKLMLTYFAYARFLKNQSVQVTSYGVRVLSDGDLSEQEVIAQIRTKVNEAVSNAIWYQRECREFINDNIDDFPLYTTTEGEKDMSWKMIKVI